MADVVIWWLVVEIAGLAALPLAWRLFANLADRGYAFAKPLAIFLLSYILWILAILGIVKNERSTVVFLVVGLAAFSWWWATRRPITVTAASTNVETAAPGTVRRATTAIGKQQRKNKSSIRHTQPPAILAWLRANVRIIVVEEGLFLTGVLVWAFFKAYNPEIIATEKPMELAFLNGILRSEQFPPVDPWLSGFSISYYYMGYLMMALLTRLSGLASTVSFNLMQVLGFALTLTGAFSIIYNLVARRTVGEGGTEQSLRAMAPPVGRVAIPAGLLASFFLAIMGNLEGFLEFFYAHGFGSQAFWKAVGIADMTQPYVSPTWYPTSNWWWWKASRVIGTKGVIGDYTINEFPFFSFMLGDNHPHVLALPYVLMALALALNILLTPCHDLMGLAREKQWTALIGVWFLPALLLGGLFFLNSWDLPTYTAIVVAAYGLRLYRERRRFDMATIKEFLLFAAPLAVLAILLYLPFYLSFQSQASGFGVVRVRSQLHHFLIIFGTFLFILVGFLAVKLHEWRQQPAAVKATAHGAIAPLAAAGLIVAAGMFFLQIWSTVTTLLLTSLAGVLVSLMLLVFILLIVFLLIAFVHADASDLFVLLLAAAGCAALLLPEWLHINDNFGGDLSRMNTVFKFQYQGWILLSLVSAYALYYVVAARPMGMTLRFSVPRIAYLTGALALVLACTFYPVMAFYTKANEFKGVPTLDGTVYMKASSPDDYNAIQWLNKNVTDTPTILEAVGGSYSEYARIATHTGLPTVLGWPGHEIQWRGTAKGWESREGDVDRIYATTDINEARNLLKKYNVTYVYVGRLERDARTADGKPKYDATALGKFATFMDVAYQQGNVTIYRMRQ